MTARPAETDVEAAVSALRELPERAVADLVRTCEAGAAAALERRTSTAVSPRERSAAEALARVARVDVSFAAGLARAHLAAPSRPRQAVDLVWTGPASGSSTHRLTMAVVLELVSEASRRLLLVSYAAREVADLGEALRAAASRDVEVVLVLERPEDNPAYTGPAHPLAGLRALRLAWPRGQRPVGASLHAKALVVDDDAALVGSANLTDSAMGRNLECGVLLRGGPHPGRIWEHVLGLRDAGVLRQVR